MTGGAFTNETIAAFETAYPEQVTTLRHALCDHPLLTLPALVELATTMPPANVEYNPAKLPIGIDPKDMPAPCLTIAQTIESIENNASWMVIKFIEQNPAYRALLAATLDCLAPVVRAKTGKMQTLQGFIFVSSPGAVTPLHFDPEHNILLQIRGNKVMTTFPATDELIAPPIVHEQFHRGEHHRNLLWNEAFAAKGTPVALGPGDAIHVPVKTPHWVQNGDHVSISLSVTWRSVWSYAEADARGLNHMLRTWGMTPTSPERFPARNLAKSLAFRGLRRLGCGS